MVWRVRLTDGSPLYIYLLLEFQSRSDPWMAVRLLAYVSLLYHDLNRDLIKSGQLDEQQRLPPVFPIVLYNGEPPWTAARLLGQLLASAPGRLAAYQVQFGYYVFDEGRVDAAERERVDNSVSSLVLLEGSPEPEALRREVSRLVQRLRAPAHDRLRRAFAVWINRVVLRRMIPAEPIPELDDLQEIDAMLAERVVEWTERWKREGLQEGLQKGLQEGRLEGLQEGLQKGLLEGRADLLHRQLTRRFGPLPEAVEARLRSASEQQLDAWAEAILDAPTLEAVFTAG